ncbi:ATP-dependent Clp endopeptidase proteolytic subunit ClpP [Candidatus Purcelliella pentastirinorum]|nr:ATP-dependent Clp endopeptidase proteolytic subunit ClpP [Candidatus Purcelliella pentastirinorum]
MKIKNNKINNTIIPMVIENCNNRERFYDIYSRLLKERIIFINGIINDELSNLTIAQMLFLEAENPKKDIYLYINSPGGNITSGLSIYDTINFIKPDINTICIGQACSMGAFLLSSGKKNKRFSLPNSTIMIHQPLSAYKGQVTDIEIHTKNIVKIKNIINEILAKNTGKTIEKIKNDTERDYFFTTKEAINYGIIDKILVKKNTK